MKSGALRAQMAAVLALLMIPSFSPSPRADGADDLDQGALDRAYQPEIRQLLRQYCEKCHSEKRIEADVDLAEFATMADVRKHPQTWQKVGEMLESGQMPPRKASQPTDAERARLRQWVHEFLTVEARARAGDPGRVVLRRLSNAEYTYTLRDLTGVDSLDPAREFPVDGAAGEGFTNTGVALVMSPSLVTKYLDAAKDVASHAVLLSDGFRFSPHTTPRDWTEESLAKIREFYREFTDAGGGGDKVNLQGIVFDTNQGGRLPVEKYLAATVAEKESLTKGLKTTEAVARERGLNARYLDTLWKALTSPEPSLLLDGLRARWRTATPKDVAGLAGEITAWQKGLWKFTTVGHIGKVGGPKAWQEPVTPLIARQEVRFKLPVPADGQDVVVSFVATDAGDGGEHDFVVWQRPRIVAPGKPELLLRDLREIARDLTERRGRIFDATSRYLGAADEARAVKGKADVAELARKYDVEADALRAWLEYLGISSGGEVALRGHFTKKVNGTGGYPFINGWGVDGLPELLANSSDKAVRVPGNMKPHGVAVHPAPTQNAAVGWKSPVSAPMRVEATVTHAHPECGNGVSWTVELRSGSTRRRLASGVAQGGKPVVVGPVEHLAIKAGDLVTLSIGAREGNHSCDLTAIDLKLTAEDDDAKVWDFAADVSGDIHAGNPHADRLGNQGVWHFFGEGEGAGGEASPVIPAGSLLAKWDATADAGERRKLGDEVRKLLTSGPPAEKGSPDATLYRELSSLGGPLFGKTPRATIGKAPAEKAEAPRSKWGLEPSAFGNRPGFGPIDDESMGVRAPSVVTVRLPAELAAGCELVATGVLDQVAGVEGSVQLEVVAGEPAKAAGLHPSEAIVTNGGGEWTANNRKTSYTTPIVVNDGSAARKRVESALDDFRGLFPPALCYSKIVPVDEVITLSLFYREDDQLCRLMLDEGQRARLDRLWDELHYVSRDSLTMVDAFAQLLEYASQDADPKVFEPMRKPINDRAAAFRRHLVDSEPEHLASLLDFAGKAYRRPLTEAESREIRTLYGKMRAEEIPHDEAIRLSIARILVSPAFLYRVEIPVPGAGQGPVSDWELASRLSYFLRSSEPDEELRQVAASGQLRDPDVLVKQARRMLRDGKTRRLATEFACQWLHIADFDHLDEKSERHFPAFLGLRGDMYEESIRFFTDLFQDDGSVFNILDADYTFLNEPLAKHYGIPLTSPPPSSGLEGGWRRVNGVKKYGRGGILGQATTLAKQSGASRTSPTLRGNWISEVLLGERLPRPPKGVPILPDDETATEGLTVRQLVEKHSSDASCVVCHERIDPFGFSLEGFDAIGGLRERDLGDRPIDTRVKAKDGAEFEGLVGLRTYLLTARRDAFLRQFCRKLLGYALGRSVQLSDEPLLAEMQAELKAKDGHVLVAVEAILRSRQFREIRGRETAFDE